MAERVRFYRRRWFQLSVVLLVTALFVWLAVRPMLKSPDDWQKVKVAFAEADYRWLPLIVLVLFVFYWLKAWRWRLLLTPVGRYRPLRDLFGPIMIGFAVNNVVPFRVGEFVRCSVFSRLQRVPLMISISSLVLERVFDSICIVLYLMLGLLFVPGVDPAIRHYAVTVAILAGVMTLAGMTYVIWTGPFVAVTEAILRRVPLLPQSFSGKVCRLLEQGAQGLGSLKDPRLLIAIFVLSLIKWGLNALLIAISLWSFGMRVSASVCLVLIAVVAFLVAIPQGPGYFGTIQFGFMKVLGLFDFPPEQVFAASVYYHLSQYIVVNVVGLTYLALYFLFSGLRMRQVIEDEQRLEHIDPGLPPAQI